MAKKTVLGKGLNALLPDASLNKEDASNPDVPSRLYRFEEKSRFLGRVAEIEINTIRPNPYQPRRDFDEVALEELARSIRELGIIQPITVRSLGEGKFELISGERRWRAARKAGLRKLPAYIREADTEAMLEMAIVENVQREDLNPIDIALGYERLIEECGLTQEQVADKVGKNRSTITNFLRLLRLPPLVQAALRDGSISNGHARALISIEDVKIQNDLLKLIVDKGLSVRQVEEQVKALQQKSEPPKKAPEPSLSHVDTLQISDFTNRLRTLMSTQVSIKHKPNGTGRIEIEYYSQDELERLLELMVKN